MNLQHLELTPWFHTFDVLDRVSTVSNVGTPGAPSVTLTSGYDVASRRTSVADGTGVTVASLYNSRGLLETRTWSGGGIEPARLDFTYNDARQRTEIERYADTTGTSQIGRTTFDYDAQGRLDEVTHRDAIDAVIADYDYLFDLADQLTSSTHHGQTTTYTHDDAGQLTAADHSVQADEDYSYDLNGNRDSAGYVTGPNNQVLSDGTFDYAYDGEGNLLTKIEIASGEITVFTYDHRNRLIAVRTFDETGEDLLQEVTFIYDVFDRRIAKSVDSDGEGVAAAVVTHFVYDGDHVWADYDSSGNVLARYLYGDRIDEILARYQPGEGTAWYLTDNLGTVRDLADDVGDLLNHIDYDSFGQIVAQTNAADGDRFTYTGREWEAELGLYYYRARFFDPQVGRFISQDPVGFAAGDPNLYRYVANQVLVMVDPFGETMVDRAVHHKEELKTAPIKSYVACLASEAYFTVAFAAIGLPPDVTDIVDLFVDCMAEAGAPGAGTAARVTDKVGDLARRGDDLVDGLKAGGKTLGKGADSANDAAKALDKAGDAGKGVRSAETSSAFGRNPFAGKTAAEVDELLRSRGFQAVGPDPAAGRGSYFHPKTGRKYYLDPGGKYKAGTELPHVDVHRMQDGVNLEGLKKKFPLGDSLYE